jgi:hypothetical protein
MKKSKLTKTMESRNEFRIVSMLVCDDIRREFNGKEILIGVYNNVIIFPSFPASLPNLVIRVGFYTKKWGTTNVKFTVTDVTSGAVVASYESPIEFKKQDAVLILGYGIAGYQFMRSTTLKATVSFNGEEHILPDITVRLPDTEDEWNRIKVT